MEEKMTRDEVEDLEEKLAWKDKEIENQKLTIEDYKKLAQDQDNLIKQYLELNRTQYNEIQFLKSEIEKLHTQMVPF